MLQLHEKTQHKMAKFEGILSCRFICTSLVIFFLSPAIRLATAAGSVLHRIFSRRKLEKYFLGAWQSIFKSKKSGKNVIANVKKQYLNARKFGI